MPLLKELRRVRFAILLARKTRWDLIPTSERLLDFWVGRSVASISIAAPALTGRVAFLQMGYIIGNGHESRNCELGSFSNNSGQTRDHEASTKHSSNRSDNGQPRLRLSTL